MLYDGWELPSKAIKTVASTVKTHAALHAHPRSVTFRDAAQVPREMEPKPCRGRGRWLSRSKSGRELVPCLVAIDYGRLFKAVLQGWEVTMITIDVNGAPRQINIEPDTPLLWVLRDVIGLTGTKFGCGIAQCGACTLHINGTAMRSCSVPIGTLDGAEIVTIEGLSLDNNHPVQRAWIEEGVPQCGYCQSGQIMAVVTFLKKYSKPTDADIDANITNICRCGTYAALRRAIHRAADLMKT